jgi:hypothetical protein
MRTSLLALVVALCVPLAAQAAATPRPLSGNLLQNPGAELGPATPDTAEAPAPVPAWEVTGGFFAAAYGAHRWAPAAADRTKGSGAKFFIGCFAAPGQTVDLGTATQVASIARFAKVIDRGGAVLTLSAELGGYDGTENRATAQAVFLTAGGAPVGKRIRLAGPTYTERQGVTRVEPRSTTAAVPKGARRVRVVLAGTRTGSGPCGFVDNVRVVVGRRAT